MSQRLTHQTLPTYTERLQRLTTDVEPRWGTMTPTQMLAHVRLVFDVSLGRREVGDISNPFSRTVMKWYAVGPIRFPRNVKAPADFAGRPDGDLDAERQQLIAAIGDFLTMAEQKPEALRPSPLFGRLSGKQWQALHGKHLDHHLRQFGL